MLAFFRFIASLFTSHKKQEPSPVEGHPQKEETKHMALLPRGIRNNNPGNINYVGQVGAVMETPLPGETARFAKFATPEDGIKALRDQLILYNKRGINTIQGVIEKWAPPQENNTQSYYNGVAHSMGVEPTTNLGTFTPRILAGMMHAIIRIENAQDPYGHLVDTIAAGETPYNG